MAASLFQVCSMIWTTLGILCVVSGVKDTKSTATRLESAVLSNRPLGIRFIAARFGSKVTLNCHSSSPVSWYKETENGKRQEVINNPRIEVAIINSSSVIEIKKLQLADSGTYYCENKESEKQICCGTQLKVMGISTFEQVQNRNTLKDAIILIQTILLVLFVSIPVFLTLGKQQRKNGCFLLTKEHSCLTKEWDMQATRLHTTKRRLTETWLVSSLKKTKDDSKKAPEDHTYEGLTVELADTYEDIGTYQDKAEKWDLAEHPCEE